MYTPFLLLQFFASASTEILEIESAITSSYKAEVAEVVTEEFTDA